MALNLSPGAVMKKTKTMLWQRQCWLYEGGEMWYLVFIIILSLIPLAWIYTVVAILYPPQYDIMLSLIPLAWIYSVDAPLNPPECI